MHPSDFNSYECTGFDVSSKGDKPIFEKDILPGK
jgi:hypothetical protein